MKRKDHARHLALIIRLLKQPIMEKCSKKIVLHVKDGTYEEARVKLIKRLLNKKIWKRK